MVRRIATATAVLIALALLAACSSLHVRSYIKTGADVLQYRAYSWGPPEPLSTGDPRLDNNRFFDERVRARINAELARRGFEEVTPLGHADVIVHYHMSVTQEIDVRTIDRQYASGTQVDDESGATVFDAGTLVIDLIDRRTDTLVWRGWAEGSLQGSIDLQEALEARIDEVVTRVLRQLPEWRMASTARSEP